MSTKAKVKKQTIEELEEQVLRNAVNAVGDAASNVMGFLGNLVFGTGRGTPEQLAELRAMITSIRKYLVLITKTYADSGVYSDMFKPISDRLKVFSKQTEAAFASNDPQQIQRAVQQAGTVSAYVTRLPQIGEDITSLVNSHRDDLGDPAKRDNVLKMMSNIIVRELTAVNLNKLGGVFKRLALVTKSMKLLPAPKGLTPQDLAKEYVDGLRQDLERWYDNDKREQAKEKENTPGAAPGGAVTESYKKLNKEVKKLHLESLKEFKSVFQESLKITLAEQANGQDPIDKFLAGVAAVARGASQAQSSAASAPASAPTTQQTSQQAPAGQLTPDQFKRVQTMLQSVTSVMGRLTPEQKKRFSGLLGQLKSVIG